MISPFKKLRAGRDSITANDWNRLTSLVTSLVRSMGGANSIMDSTGLHIRRSLPIEPETIIYYGKPTGSWTLGTTITLDPCDRKGIDNGNSNISVYLKTDKSSESISSATIAGSSEGVTCSIGTSIIIPFIKIGDEAHILGIKKQVLTEFRVVGSPTYELQCKVRFDFGLFFSSESGWETVHEGTPCT